MNIIILIAACVTSVFANPDPVVVEVQDKEMKVQDAGQKIQHSADPHHQKVLMRKVEKEKKIMEEKKIMMRRKKDSKMPHLLEEEDASPASLLDEGTSHPQTMNKEPSSSPHSHPQRVTSEILSNAWNDEIDEDAVLDELEAITQAEAFKGKHDPPPSDCTWNSWTKKGSCRPTASGSCGVSGEQEYSRTKIPEQWGGSDCTGSDSKTESGCALPACPPTPAPTPAPTTTAMMTTTMADGKGLHVGFATFMGLFTVVLWNLR